MTFADNITYMVTKKLFLLLKVIDFSRTLFKKRGERYFATDIGDELFFSLLLCFKQGSDFSQEDI
jgi:hypothetical protein